MAECDAQIASAGLVQITTSPSYSGFTGRFGTPLDNCVTRLNGNGKTGKARKEIWRRAKLISRVKINGTARVKIAQQNAPIGALFVSNVMFASSLRITPARI